MQETRQIKTSDLQINVVASVRTDVGCVREANEDAGRHVQPNDAETQILKGTLTIVADGMGGHASGEVASRMAVDLIGEYYYGDRDNAPVDALKNAIENASSDIYQHSLTDESLFGMGTTVVALVLFGETAIAAHVGDSRLYRLRGEHLEPLTTDHSQVMEMVKHGILSMEEARNHEDKNVILRAVGTQPEVEAEVTAPFPVRIGDAFLLCSDGLSDMMDDEQIEKIMVSVGDYHTACELLIDAAKKHGGHDNITVGIVGISTADSTPKTVRATRDIQVR